MCNLQQPFIQVVALVVRQRYAPVGLRRPERPMYAPYTSFLTVVILAQGGSIFPLGLPS